MRRILVLLIVLAIVLVVIWMRARRKRGDEE
jgi:membrane protein DedA with SNARE-associated domain